MSLAVLRNSNTPDESVELMAGTRVDFAARLSSERASRSSKPRVFIAPATTVATTIPPPPPTTAKPKPKPAYKATTVTTAKPKPASPKPAATSSPATATATPDTVSPRAMPSGGGTSAGTESGKASWYEAKYHAANPWICAHKTIPKGTVLTVVAVNSGRSITCEVGDRGPYVEGRILDLSKHAFSQLANPSSGVIPVKISW